MYNKDTEYEFPYRTYCGRIVSSDKGYQDIIATDLKEEYTCKSCHNIKNREGCRPMDKIVHKYMGRSFWTLCGRYVDETNGLMQTTATYDDDKVTCRACRSQINE